MSANYSKQNPGVGSIRETFHHIIGKAILAILRDDIMDAVGVHQLCTGQKF